MNTSGINLTVLLADDNQDHNHLLAVTLTRLGYKLVFAENGKTAYALAAARPFDLILLDLQMPELSGYDVTRLLRAAGYKTPIVMISAHAFECHRAVAAKAGVTAYLTKPLDFPKLRQLLASLLPAVVPVSMPCPTHQAGL